jgi:hypothetical protein
MFFVNTVTTLSAADTSITQFPMSPRSRCQCWPTEREFLGLFVTVTWRVFLPDDNSRYLPIVGEGNVPEKHRWWQQPYGNLEVREVTANIHRNLYKSNLSSLNTNTKLYAHTASGHKRRQEVIGMSSGVIAAPSSPNVSLLLRKLMLVLHNRAGLHKIQSVRQCSSLSTPAGGLCNLMKDLW